MSVKSNQLHFLSGTHHSNAIRYFDSHKSIFLIVLGNQNIILFQLLKESLELCLKGYGEKHLLTTRIYLNTGICFEQSGDYATAFSFFKRLKETCFAVSTKMIGL